MGEVIYFPVMTHDHTWLPNRIREWRLRRGHTQIELGELVGLTGVMISHLETGRRDLGYKQMQAIARALNVDTIDLLSKDDNPYLMGDAERDFMRVFVHVPDAARPSLQAVAENLAGFRAQPAVLDLPSGADKTEDQPAKRKGSAAA